MVAISEQVLRTGRPVPRTNALCFTRIAQLSFAYISLRHFVPTTASHLVCRMRDFWVCQSSRAENDLTYGPRLLSPGGSPTSSDRRARMQMHLEARFRPNPPRPAATETKRVPARGRTKQTPICALKARKTEDVSLLMEEILITTNGVVLRPPVRKI